MKYGYFIGKVADRAMEDKKNCKANIGDNVQSYAIQNLYKHMGINLDEVVEIMPTELNNYNGEYVVVPFAQAFSNYKRMNVFPVSHKIIPVIISMAMCDEDCDEIVPYLKKHEPIGCRDEITMNLFRRKGIEAYLSGCLTITLPKRKETPNKKKVFLIDVPQSLKEYIPTEIRQYCEELTHEVEVNNYPMTDEDFVYIDCLAKKQFQRYEKEATLVVTSRLHAAVPCIAMGIPVIVAVNNIDYRFSWVDKLVPIYTPQKFDLIDWNPKSLELEGLKKQVAELFFEQMINAFKKREKMYTISQYYETRERMKYNHELTQKIDYVAEMFQNNSQFRYGIWGMGVHGKLALSMMKERFPNAHCACLVDKYMTGEIAGIDIIKPEMLREDMFDYLLIATYPGRKEAQEKMLELEKEEMRNYMFFMSKNDKDE